MSSVFVCVDYYGRLIVQFVGLNKLLSNTVAHETHRNPRNHTKYRGRPMKYRNGILEVLHCSSDRCTV